MSYRNYVCIFVCFPPALKYFEVTVKHIANYTYASSHQSTASLSWKVSPFRVEFFYATVDRSKRIICMRCTQAGYWCQACNIKVRHLTCRFKYKSNGSFQQLSPGVHKATYARPAPLIRACYEVIMSWDGHISIQKHGMTSKKIGCITKQKWREKKKDGLLF